MSPSSLSSQVKLWSRGILDALSLHQTLPILVNSPSAALITAKILGANCVLVLGSVALFDRGITPVASHYGGLSLGAEIAMDTLEAASDAAVHLLDGTKSSGLGWALFQLLWLAPMCVLCYVLSTVWYQDLADVLHKDLPPAVSSPRATATKTLGAQHTIYATVAWLCVFAQVQLLVTVFPACIRMLTAVVDRLVGTEDVSTITQRAAMWFGHQAATWILFLIGTASRWIGLTLMAALYAWYAFDPKWIAQAVSPTSRFAILEHHAAYFIGFGTPFVALVRLSSFWIGFGGYLAAFPLAIILASRADYISPYNEIRQPKSNLTIPLFKSAQNWTYRLIAMVTDKCLDLSSEELTSSTNKRDDMPSSTNKRADMPEFLRDDMRKVSTKAKKNE